MAKYHWGAICIAILLESNDSAALERNKFLLHHLKTGPGLFLAPVLQAPNL
jgi:hypothetical protein